MSVDNAEEHPFRVGAKILATGQDVKEFGSAMSLQFDAKTESG